MYETISFIFVYEGQERKMKDGRIKDMNPLIKLGSGLNCKMVVDRHLELVPVSLTALLHVQQSEAVNRSR